MDTKLNKRIGKRISTARRLRNLSQEEFATQSKVSRGFLSDIERGRKAVAVDTLVRICKVARMSPTQVLAG